MASPFRGKVLIAEGSGARQIREVLESAGVEVTIVNHGQEAVEVALATHFDLILIDGQISGVDGVGATRMLRQVGCQTPIVALSSSGTPLYWEQFEQAGCSEVLSRSIDREALMSVLGRYLVSGGGEEAFQGGGVEDDFLDDELKQLFVERTAILRAELQASYAKEDWSGVRVTAHTVKGSGSTFGYPELSRLGKEICDAIDLQQLESAPDLVEQLDREMSKV